MIEEVLRVVAARLPCGGREENYVREMSTRNWVRGLHGRYWDCPGVKADRLGSKAACDTSAGEGPRVESGRITDRRRRLLAGNPLFASAPTQADTKW